MSEGGGGGSSGGVGVGTVVVISLVTSFAVTLGVLAFAMRQPLPLIDTQKSQAVFDTTAGTQKAA